MKIDRQLTSSKGGSQYRGYGDWEQFNVKN